MIWVCAGRIGFDVHENRVLSRPRSTGVGNGKTTHVILVMIKFDKLHINYIHPILHGRRPLMLHNCRKLACSLCQGFHIKYINLLLNLPHNNIYVGILACTDRYFNKFKYIITSLW